MTRCRRRHRSTLPNTRVIAVGISNGGGAVLRAAEDGSDWLDAVVAGEPNVLAEGHGARNLYDYSTEAALLMPCALPALGIPAMPGLSEMRGAGLAWRAVGRHLRRPAAGSAGDAARGRLDRCRPARGLDQRRLRPVARGWRRLRLSHHGRYPHDAHPCGYRYSAMNPDTSLRAATTAERAAWVADASGIPPGAGVGIVDPQPLADWGSPACSACVRCGPAPVRMRSACARASMRPRQACRARACRWW